MSKDTIIKLNNVWKIYQMGDVKVEAVRGVDLAIKRGEFVSIMGASGSGKSTMMNLIGCLDIPTRGNIYLDNKNIAHMSESDLAQIRGKMIGFIFQQFNLIPTLSAIENVMLPMTFQNVPKEERLEKAEKYLNMVELGERVRHKPNELSGGQQQRVAIARSLSNDPQVVLADEPTGNLDPNNAGSLLDTLSEFHSGGGTILLVTHDAHATERAGRIMELDHGSIRDAT